MLRKHASSSPFGPTVTWHSLIMTALSVPCLTRERISDMSPGAINHSWQRRGKSIAHSNCSQIVRNEKKKKQIRNTGKLTKSSKSSTMKTETRR